MRNENLKGNEKEVKEVRKWKFSDEDLKIIDFYYKDNQKELKKIVNQILNKNFAWVTDREPFESMAGFWIGKLLQDYDGERDFRGYLFFVLQRKFKSQIKRTNRKKRRNIIEYENGEIEMIEDVSIYSPIGEKGNATYEDILASKSTVEKEVLDKNGYLDPNIDKFMKKLPRAQVKIVNMIMDGYKPNEIQKILGMTPTRYNQHIHEMKSHDNAKMLMEVKKRWNY